MSKVGEVSEMSQSRGHAIFEPVAGGEDPKRKIWELFGVRRSKVPALPWSRCHRLVGGNGAQVVYRSPPGMERFEAGATKRAATLENQLLSQGRRNALKYAYIAPHFWDGLEKARSFMRSPLQR
jgi:hypothetical protein